MSALADVSIWRAECSCAKAWKERCSLEGLNQGIYTVGT